MTPSTPISIAKLAGMIEAIQAPPSDGNSEAHPPVATHWAPIAQRALHEWFAQIPPQMLMIDIAARAVAARLGWAFWVGRACWPYALSLAQGRAHQADLLRRSMFVDTPRRDLSSHVWALDLVLRSPAASAVIADGRGLETAHSRRLQLAAEAAPGLAMLWRKPVERKVISVAHYRWQVEPVPTPDKHPRWRVETLRCKDAAAFGQGGLRNHYLVEHRDAEGIVAVPAHVANRSSPSQTASQEPRGARSQEPSRSRIA